jgi:hypothetical protein
MKGLLMGRWMILGNVVGLIGFSGLSVDNELELLDSVAGPVEAHVRDFGSAFLKSLVGYALGTFIVCLDRGRRLHMTKFF